MNPYEELLRQAGWLPGQDGPEPVQRPTGGVNYGPASPADEATVLDMAKHAAAKGLGAFQGVMDTLGGRAIKGLLAGKPRELLSVLPLSDTLHITDPTQRTSGRDLLEKWGAVNHAEPGSGLDTGDVAGFGLDMALDPASYLFGPGAALTKAGKVAKAANILPGKAAGRIGQTLGEVLEGVSPEVHIAAQNAAKAAGTTVEELAGQQLGGLGGFGLPFARNASVIFGTGDKALQAAEYLGKGTDWLGKTLPFRVGRAVFNKNVEGNVGPYEQEMLLAGAPRANRAAQRGERSAISVAREMQNAGGYSEEVAPLLRGHMEGMQQPEVSMLTAEQRAGLEAGAQRAEGYFNAAHELERQVGLPANKRPGYFPLQAEGLETPTAGYEAYGRGTGQGVSAMSPHQLARDEIFSHIEGGTAGRNALAKDLEISGPMRAMKQAGRDDTVEEAAYIARQYLGLRDHAALDLDQLRKLIGAKGMEALDPDQLARYNTYLEKLDHAGHLADWASKLDPQYAGKQLDFFSNNPFQAISSRVAGSERVVARARAILGTAAKYATTADKAAPDAVPIVDILARAGLTGPEATRALAKTLEDAGKLSNIRASGESIADALLGVPGGGALSQEALGKVAQPIGNLGQYYVPREFADAIGRISANGKAPEAAGKITNLIDSATALWKAGVSNLWPKKYFRDAGQGAFRNIGQMGIGQGLAAEKAALDVVKNGKVWDKANLVPGLEHMTPEGATRQLADEFASYNGHFTKSFGRAGEEIGETGQRGFLEHLPGEEKRSLTDILKWDPQRNTTLDPRDIAGFNGRQQTKFAPLVAGAKINELGDEVNKAAQFFGKRMEGYSADAAWDAVRGSHYDYTNMSSIERNVLRRAIPFYNWNRQNIPASLEELFNHPGGLEATVARGASALRSKELVPATAGDVLAVPLGQNEDGSKRYLGRTGLQAEDAIRTLGFATNPADILGELSPGIKLPLELATGRQLGTGRRLNEVQGKTGNPILDEIIRSSPASRTASSLSTLLDERKGAAAKAFNLLAPAAVTDVNPETREQALRQVVEDALSGSPNASQFERFYTKPENLPKLSPEELLLMRVYTAQEKQAQAEAKSRKIAVGR